MKGKSKDDIIILIFSKIAHFITEYCIFSSSKVIFILVTREREVSSPREMRSRIIATPGTGNINRCSGRINMEILSNHYSCHRHYGKLLRMCTGLNVKQARND